MTERPILFSGPMVRAILEGRKTQTRRVLKGAPMRLWAASGWEIEDGDCLWCDAYGDYHSLTSICPYGRIGDRLWVRETHYISDEEREAVGGAIHTSVEAQVYYRADSQNHASDGVPWRPSIHMPRWASRITLEVVSVRVERLQDISANDAYAEGVIVTNPDGCDPVMNYCTLWESINGPSSWDANPWVWAVEFRCVSP